MKTIRMLMVSGTAWLAGGQIVTLAVGFLLTPFIIRRLGTENYGALNLTLLIINYIMFSDLGQGLASTKFASEAYARADDKREAEVLWTSLGLVIFSTALAVTAVEIVAPYLVVDLLTVPPDIQRTTILALRIACLGYFARSLICVLNSPMMVRMRMRIYATINSGTIALQTVLVLLALMMGGGLVAASAVGAGVGWIATSLMATFAFRIQPKLAHSQPCPALVAPLLRFGFPFTISAIVGALVSQGERLLLAKFIGVKELAYYTVAFTLAQLVDLVPNALSQTMLPAFTQAKASGGSASLKSIARFTTRTILLYVVPAAVFLIVIGRKFLLIWAGPDFSRSGFIPLLILVFGKFIEMTSYSSRVQLVVLDRPDIIPRIQVVEVLPYLAIGGILTAHYGIIGAAVTWSLRSVIECLVVWVAVRRLTRS